MIVSRRGLAEAALALSVLLGAWTVADARRSHRPVAAETPGEFEFYVLSLSVAPSFCALDRGERPRAECDNPSDAAFQERPLTVHGLWPNRAGVSGRRQPQDCSAEREAALPPDLQADLARYMPGTADGLDRYEWRKHGSCSGLDPAAYWRAAVTAARTADAAVGAVIRERRLFGSTVRIDDLLAGVAAHDPALARAIVVDCRFAPKRAGQTEPIAYIAEIRIALDRDFPNAVGDGGTIPPGAFLPLSQVGFHANSGCPGGAGFLPGGYVQG